MITLSAEGIRLTFDPALGQIVSFTVTDGGQPIAPLHRAPWVGTDEAMPPDAAPHLATLGGDFFCAPFGGREKGSPLHGWPANTPWTVTEERAGTLTATLQRSVFGAALVKRLTLSPGSPFVLQTHTFVGGAGALPVANHANVALPNGGLIRTSPKAAWETPNTPQETDPTRGRSGLAYPASAIDPRAFPAEGGPVDLTRYPWFPRHEDFVVAREAPGNPLGWTAVTRPSEGDVFLSLRNPAALPMTMLWHSNGGRDYAPWSSRHFGCLGVEEGAAGAILPPDETALTLDPDGAVSVHHAIGALAWPTGEPVADITADTTTLTVRGEKGHQRTVPFEAHHLFS